MHIHNLMSKVAALPAFCNTSSLSIINMYVNRGIVATVAEVESDAVMCNACHTPQTTDPLRQSFTHFSLDYILKDCVQNSN